MPLQPSRTGPRCSRRLLYKKKSKANIESQFQNPNINPSSGDLSGSGAEEQTATDPVAPGEASDAMVCFGGVCGGGVRSGCLVTSFTFYIFFKVVAAHIAR